MKLKTIDVKGRKFAIEVNDNGSFYTEFDGERVSANLLDLLTKTLMRKMAVQQVKLAIPFCIWDSSRWDNDGGKIRTGVITGIHGGNSNLLVKYGTGKVEQYSEWHTDHFFDPNKADELERLHKAVIAARAALDRFYKQNAWNGKDRTREGIARMGVEVEE